MVGVPASPSAVFGVCRDALPNWVRPFPTETAWWPTPPTAAIFRSDTHRTFHARRRVRARPVRPQGLHPRNGRRGRRQRPLRPADPHPVSPRAERLSAHRPRQVDLPQLRHRPRVRRPVNLRFDDTNPSTEDIKYVEAIKRGHPVARLPVGRRALRQRLLREALRDRRAAGGEGKAYVDSQSEEEIREQRGTVTAPGTPSPFRDRSVEENLDLLRRMRAGEFPDGAHVLRAKIDLAHPNMIMRDPLLLRIRHALTTGAARLVHLPAVRLRPRALRRDRGDHPLALHPRVQGQQGHLRLAGARGRVRAAAGADRVRPAGARLHRGEQAQAAPAGERGARGGVGRSPDADPRRDPAARA